MQTPQQPGEILSSDKSPSLNQGNPQLAALLRPFGPYASTADLSQSPSQPVCKLLQAYPANRHLLAPDESAGQSWVGAADERGCDE
jgi:hypothetical protein